MKIVLIISIILLTTSSIAVLNSTIKNSLKFKIKSKARSIDEDFIQEIVNGITNGLVPRIVLAKLCEDYFLTQTKEAALSGKDLAPFGKYVKTMVQLYLLRLINLPNKSERKKN
jgi:hypothetical protein